MVIIGMRKTIKEVWVVYIPHKRYKYFLGAYVTEAKAKQVADKFHGKYFYKNS